MYEVKLDGVSCLKLKILPTRRPDIPAPKRKYEQIAIPGRSGSLVETDESYESIVIPVEFGFISSPEKWNTTFRSAKKWLSGKGKLQFSDDEDFFYLCQNCEITGTERTVKEIGKFTAEFLCDPYMYAVSGDTALEDYRTFENNYMESHPKYEVEGNGDCTLTVNGKNMKMVVNGQITIDTELMIAYNRDMVSQNNLLSGEYEDLYLKEGRNVIDITEGFTLEVFPRWRCL